MKKLSIICALACVPFIACQKKYCWKCATFTTTMTAPSGSIFTGYTTDTATTRFNVCDQTASGIKAYEKTTSSDLTEGNLIVNTLSTTTCNQ